MSTHRLKCVHCGGGLRIRNSISQHSLLRNTYLHCTNTTCGATFRGAFEITHEMSPSGSPNPDIQLPIADAEVRREARDISL